VAGEYQLEGLRIVLGVTGGVAAYKSPDLVRRLKDAGADVRVVLTRGAEAFVTPLTFQAVSGHPVHTKLLDEAAEAGMGHIELARWADLVVIAPATADFIARLAHGLADDLLSTLCVATSAPISVAPAMNRQMWANAATRDNCATLERRDVRLLGPASGSQACGETGEGRMLEPTDIVALLAKDAHQGVLAGRHVVITAGPTYEDIDPVRFIGNRSSGKMGMAVAAAARAAGARVSLVAGPTSLPAPAGVRRTDVRGAVEMRDAVFALLPDCDVFIAVAAVADYTPADKEPHKIKKGAQSIDLALVPTPDIVAEVAASEPRPFTVGFAAETRNLIAYARDKLEKKGLDMIAANRVGSPEAGFESDDNEIVLISEAGELDLGRGSKRELAGRLVAAIAQAMDDGEEESE
jgi:phosphopantothenoylcysteine decarboxylase/phosphopantothenate--cysteine ligase